MTMATTSPVTAEPSAPPLFDPKLFPVLTPEQLERAVGHGRKRSVAQGEVLLDVGEKPSRIWVVTRGLLDVVRSFILRRLSLIERHLSDAVLIGSNHCAGTLRIRDFLTRNDHPYSEIDLD